MSRVFKGELVILQTCETSPLALFRFLDLVLPGLVEVAEEGTHSCFDVLMLLCNKGFFVWCSGRVIEKKAFKRKIHSNCYDVNSCWQDFKFAAVPLLKLLVRSTVPRGSD